MITSVLIFGAFVRWCSCGDRWDISGCGAGECAGGWHVGGLTEILSTRMAGGGDRQGSSRDLQLQGADYSGRGVPHLGQQGADGGGGGAVGGRSVGARGEVAGAGSPRGSGRRRTRGRMAVPDTRVGEGVGSAIASVAEPRQPGRIHPQREIAYANYSDGPRAKPGAGPPRIPSPPPHSLLSSNNPTESVRAGASSTQSVPTVRGRRQVRESPRVPGPPTHPLPSHNNPAESIRSGRSPALTAPTDCERSPSQGPPRDPSPPPHPLPSPDSPTGSNRSGRSPVLTAPTDCERSPAQRSPRGPARHRIRY